MNPYDDRDENEACSSCGAVLLSDSERGFRFGTGNVLCTACAIARGGQYDAARDAWSVLPDLSGLADEAYGSTPNERGGRFEP